MDEPVEISHVRADYGVAPLDESKLSEDPNEQLQSWLDEAFAAGIKEANAMSLATASRQAEPSVRIVLLRRLDSQGLVFYTNYESRKGAELEENPQVAICFYWEKLHRQVRVCGKVQKLSRTDSSAYFATRPRGSCLAAWASEQSRPLNSRDQLEQQFRKMEEKFEGQEVDLPSFWGGYLVTPFEFEFWQGHRNRMHDRILYSREDDGWRKGRLSP